MKAAAVELGARAQRCRSARDCRHTGGQHLCRSRSRPCKAPCPRVPLLRGSLPSRGASWERVSGGEELISAFSAMVGSLPPPALQIAIMRRRASPPPLRPLAAHPPGTAQARGRRSLLESGPRPRFALVSPSFRPGPNPVLSEEGEPSQPMPAIARTWSAFGCRRMRQLGLPS
jgi:hypothetical protein